MKIDGLEFKKSYTIKIAGKDIKMKKLFYSVLRHVDNALPYPPRPMCKQVNGKGVTEMVFDTTKEDEYTIACEEIDELRTAVNIYLSFDDPSVTFDNNVTLDEINLVSARAIYSEMSKMLPANAWTSICTDVMMELGMGDNDLAEAAESFLAQRGNDGLTKSSPPQDQVN